MQTKLLIESGDSDAILNEMLIEVRRLRPGGEVMGLPKSHHANFSCLRKSDRAFTLIEILVVVAIIALLISILMPALSSAKRRARMVVCASNLHTMGQATFYYAQASKDDLPAGYRLKQGAKKPYGPEAYELSLNAFEFLYPQIQKINVKQVATGWDLPIPTYLCPEDRMQHDTDQRPIMTPIGLQNVKLKLSYGLNYSLVMTKIGDRNAGARKLGSVKNASSVVSIMDAGDDQAQGSNGWVLADCRADFNLNQCFFELRHYTGNQFLYLDGHVSFSQAARLSKPKVANDRENYGLPPYPSAFIPNWGPSSPDYATKDAMGHSAPIKASEVRQKCSNGC